MDGKQGMGAWEEKVHGGRKGWGGGEPRDCKADQVNPGLRQLRSETRPGTESEEALARLESSWR